MHRSSSSTPSSPLMMELLTLSLSIKLNPATLQWQHILAASRRDLVLSILIQTSWVFERFLNLKWGLKCWLNNKSRAKQHSHCWEWGPNPSLHSTITCEQDVQILDFFHLKQRPNVPLLEDVLMDLGCGAFKNVFFTYLLKLLPCPGSRIWGRWSVKISGSSQWSYSHLQKYITPCQNQPIRGGRVVLSVSVTLVYVLLRPYPRTTRILTQTEDCRCAAAADGVEKT